jgi:hypothetical protein
MVLPDFPPSGEQPALCEAALDWSPKPFFHTDKIAKF